ncbi:Site-specific DNA-methyltransferase [Candidatus Hepatincolaceae symbiont of Richtersius coronifer]
MILGGPVGKLGNVQIIKTLNKFESKIICGDILEQLKKINKNYKFDVIIVDPPYNIGKDFGNSNDTMEIGKYIKWSKKWLNLCFEILADDGLIYVYGFPEILARLAVEYPIEKQRILAWHYTNKATPSFNFWQRSYESILCLWKNVRPSLEINQIREPYTERYLKFAGKERKGIKGRFGDKTTLYNVNEGGALPRDVIKIPALAGGAGRLERHFMCKTCNNTLYNSKELKKHKEHIILQHPTQKPMELTKKLIQSRINGNNGRILIPFAGSGSECVAAKKLGIEFLGIELNPEYVEYANKWLDIE